MGAGDGEKLSGIFHSRLFRILAFGVVIVLAVAARRNFTIANLFMPMLGVIIYGTTPFIPQLLQEVLGYTAADAGLALTLGGIVTLVVMPLAGYLTNRVDARYLIGMAFALQAIALWNMSPLNTRQPAITIKVSILHR